MQFHSLPPDTDGFNEKINQAYGVPAPQWKTAARLVYQVTMLSQGWTVSHETPIVRGSPRDSVGASSLPTQPRGLGHHLLPQQCRDATNPFLTSSLQLRKGGLFEGIMTSFIQFSTKRWTTVLFCLFAGRRPFSRLCFIYFSSHCVLSTVQAARTIRWGLITIIISTISN